MKQNGWQLIELTHPNPGQACEITHPKFPGTRMAEWTGDQWRYLDCVNALQQGFCPARGSAWRHPVSEKVNAHDITPMLEFYHSLWEACSRAGGGMSVFREDPKLSELATLLAPNGVRFTFMKPQ